MRNNKQIKISLIIATSNRPDNLEELLESLKKAGVLIRADLEVIVVDNAPIGEETRNLCKNYSVLYFVEKIPGKLRAVNMGVKKARGSYLAFTDDDVIIKDSNWLDKMMTHFEKNKNTGYVAGNVLAYKTETEAEKIWEGKGALSKGEKLVVYTVERLSRFKHLFTPWPINKIATGANSMIPRIVLDKVGLFSNLFDPGSPLPHGGTLEIVYRIIKTGYTVIYEPKSKVFHKHPDTSKLLKRKLFIYGIGNSAYQFYVFVKHRDFRSLYWALLGHNLYVIGNLLKGFFGLYKLPFSYTIYSLAGSVIGAPFFMYKYITRDKKLYH